jgi:hypothetical protein
MAKNENIQRADVDSNNNTAQRSPRNIVDTVTEDQIDRLEAITGGDDEDETFAQSDNLQREFNSIDASTEEELDALQVNLTQDDDIGASRDGTGRVIDELGQEELAKTTEVGPGVNDRGARSVEPGRQDTSGVLRRHRPATPVGTDPDAIGEGNIDEPLDEGLD